MNRRTVCIFLFATVLAMRGMMAIADDLTNIPVAAPIDTDSAGRSGDIAIHTVVHLICVEQNSMGTGFLHKSGNIITADHVSEAQLVGMVLNELRRQVQLVIGKAVLLEDIKAFLTSNKIDP
jgi:hypothetical protein